MQPVFPITTVEELDLAIAAVGKLNGEETRITAELDRELQVVRDGYKNKYLVPSEQGTVPLSEARKAMLEEITAYCEEHREELLSGEKKSLELTHGTIGWTKQPDSIQIKTPKAKKGKDGEQIEQGLLAKLLALATTAITVAGSMLGKATAISLVRVKVDWDKPSIMKAYVAKQLPKTVMTKEGITVKAGQDQFYCDPKVEAPAG